LSGRGLFVGQGPEMAFRPRRSRPGLHDVLALIEETGRSHRLCPRVLRMTTAQAFRVLWIGVILGLTGCVSPSREQVAQPPVEVPQAFVGMDAPRVEAEKTRCLGEVAGRTSYMSSSARWDLSANSRENVSGGYLQGYRQRLEQDARAKRQDCT
jgi:hypothetical protein